MLPSASDRGALGALGITPTVDYGAFALVHLGPGTAEALRARGLQLVEGERLTHLYLGRYAFDPLTAMPTASTDLGPNAMGDGRGSYIVQFIGPVLAAWVQALGGAGAFVGDYLPNDAFLVRMDSNALARVSALPEVRWVGPYDPAFRLSPNLDSLQGQTQVNILIFRDQEAQALPSLGSLLGSRGSSVDTLARLGPYDLVRSTVSPGDVRDLARLPDVYWVEAYTQPQLHNQFVPATIQSASQGLVSNVTGGNVPVWNAGITGSGEVVALTDTGIDYDHIAFRQTATTVGTPGPMHRKIFAYHIMPGGDTKDNDVSGHGTHTANILAGDAAAIGGTDPNLEGNAYKARISFDDLAGPSDALGGIPPDLANLFWQNYLDGARVASNSWGSGPPQGAAAYTGGVYDGDSWSADNFSWAHKDMLLVFSAGNSGLNPGTTSSPATAKDTLAVGATWDGTPSPTTPPSFDYLASFSSRGATQDGRIKPEVTAPGTGYAPNYPNILSADSDGSLTTLNSGTIGLSGTSMAAPAVAAAAVLAHQYFRGGYYPSGTAVAADGFMPSSALLKALLINSAREMSTAGSCTACAHLHPWTNLTPMYYPNDDQGYGRITLGDALYFPGDGRLLYAQDSTLGLTTGQAVDVDLQVTSPGMLKVTLAWTDAPGSLAGGRELVNDLDLEVTQVSTGTLYRGNVYTAGTISTAVSAGSLANPSTPADNINNVEQVQVNAPLAGTYRLRVRATNVPVGPQPFALVATGGLAANVGALTLDRASYGEGSSVGIRLVAQGATSPVVTIASGFEPQGEVVALTPLGGGVFTATVPTTLDPPAVDGRISVRTADAITVTYQNGAYTTRRTAAVDLGVPAIGPVTTVTTPTGGTIYFMTSKPASATVRWGPTAALGAAPVVEGDLRTTHAIAIPGLAPNTTYFFDLVLRDQVGHTVTDTNGGRHYSFTTGLAADILLVDGTHGTVPAVTIYQADLAPLGWTTQTWDVAAQGDPSLATLQGFRAVAWEIGDYYPPLSFQEMALLKAYLDGGGRLMVASHDVAWAFGDSRTSPFYNATVASWLAGVLKAVWSLDLNGFPLLYGVSADPISGAYTAGAPYAAFRPGAGGDEVSAVAAGGTTAPVWYDNTARNALPVGLRWTSSANNGTAGVGAWGGRPSRLLAYFFEPFRINPGISVGVQRRDILDKSFTWLLERSHPQAVALRPSAGEVVTSSPYTITWSVTATGPTVSSLFLSADGGSSWRFLAATPSTSYTWDLSTVNNGATYRVRIQVRDQGNPALQTVVDGPAFVVRIPGHDPLGPPVRAGTLVVSPNAATAGGSATVNATVDDTTTGASNIAGAELFFDAVGAPGTGLAMAASVGTLGTQPAQAVTWTGAINLGPGYHQAFVRGRDQAGNWGPTANATLQVDLARNLQDFPDPFLVNGQFQATVVIGNSVPHNGVGASSTIDVVGAIPLASSLGTHSTSGVLASQLDYEAVAADGTTVTTPGNLITLGSRGVNVVTRIYNQSLPVHIEDNRGVCSTATGHCFRNTVNGTTGAVTQYAYVSMVWVGGRYVLSVAGLSGYATRAASQLLAQGILAPRGAGLILRLDDRNGDNAFETYHIQEAVEGVADALDHPFPAPPTASETFVVGLSQAHGVTGGAASTIDVVGGVELASVHARALGQAPWAVLDIDIARVDPSGTSVTIAPTGNLVALGGRGSNMVSWAYNSSLPIRFETSKGICVVATGHCYKISGTYGQGAAVTDYAMDTTYFDAAAARSVEVFAGLSGFSTRGALAALASGKVARIGSGIVLQLQDSNGDGTYESVTVVEAVP